MSQSRVVVVCLLVSGACLNLALESGESRLAVVLPLDRTAYFIGETVPLAIAGTEGEVKLEAVNSDGRVLLYNGKPCALWLDTLRLAPGSYTFEINGAPTGQEFFLVGVLRKSAGSMQDECAPRDPPAPTPQEAKDPAARAAREKAHWDSVVTTFNESGLTASFALAQSDMRRVRYLDAMARAGALLLVNCDTRPTSFFPVGNDPVEIDGMSQRMILTAQANGRYPNFAGFCLGWDPTGYAVGGRKGLMTYWGWGDKTDALRNYIARQDQHNMDEFTRRTGMKPVTDTEYVSYLLSIGQAALAPAIDLPTKLWLAEIARHVKPLPEGERAELEQRLDAWSQYLMGLYHEAYGAFQRNFRRAQVWARTTSSVQVDHAAVRHGQYFPSAYEPLQFRYQSTWNDQVGGPDYTYQWLFTAGLLDMHRSGRPTWISNAFGAVHGLTQTPGKFTRVAAHGLAWGGSGIGFACEGFSNLLGGMNAGSAWQNIKDKPAGQDVLAGREFLHRFAALALEGRGDHGAGILFSKSQFSRQHLAMGFGVPAYKAFVALTRLGYTPRFVTEEELAEGKAQDVKALVVLCHTVPFPEKVAAGIGAFIKGGGRVLTDGSCSVAVPGSEKLELTFPFTVPGKPHNWAVPNIVAGDNDTLMYARWHEELAPAFSKALGETGRGVLRPENGAATEVSLMQIDGGPDARFVVAVNDSHVRNQADWHQVQEKLLPAKTVAAESFIYDCTDEKLVSKAEPFVCDLSATTARVFAVLPREMKGIALSATQTISAGGDVIVKVEFLDGGKKPLAAVLPFNLTVARPDGVLFQGFYRATDRHGAFSMAVPIPANTPAGMWAVSVRSQLNGENASLPVTVGAAEGWSCARPISDTVVVRRAWLAEGVEGEVEPKSVVLPIFDSPSAPKLLSVAEKAKAALARRGIEVEIRQKPELGIYTLSYDPTEAQKQENARADKGETIGKIKRETVNSNDWCSALSGYRFGLPVILLDLANERGDNLMAEALDAAGLLWPQVSEAFPGKGRAVVQGVQWAFGPHVSALVIQAWDAEGLAAGAEALAKLPEDRTTNGTERTQAALWEQFGVGRGPREIKAEGLTANALKTSHAPKPFVMNLMGQTPPAAEQVKPPERLARNTTPVPAVFEPKQYVTYMRDGGGFIEAGTASMLVNDLRFSEAIMLITEVKQPGKMRIVAEGQFRYSDRSPRSQAQWEDILAIREKVVPKERRPMEVVVQLGGKIIGKLVPARTEQRDVPIEMLPSYACERPRTVNEEVVLQLAGEVDLPAGRQELLLIHRNIVDGVLERVAVGLTDEEVKAWREKKAAEEEAKKTKKK